MNLLKRIFIALICIPIILYFVLNTYYYALLFSLFLLAVSIVGSFEFYNILKTKKIIINKNFILFANIFIFLCFYISAFNSSLIFLPYFSFIFVNFIFFISQILLKEFDNVIALSSSFILLTFYLPFLLGHMILLKSLCYGNYFLFLIITMIWTNDSFAYFCGMLFGRKKWNIKASPNKTYAGVIGGILFSILAVFFVNHIFQLDLKFKIWFFEYKFSSSFIFNTVWSIIIGVVFGVIGIVSDLIESIFKRCAKIKDSDRLLPGHGGVLDVFDSSIFTSALFYYFILLLKYFKVIS